MRLTNAIPAAAIGATLLFTSFFSSPARADEFNDRTKVTFSDPVRVPGVTLPAGTYIFKVLQAEADRIVVEVSNERESHVFATLIARHNTTGTKETRREDPIAPTPSKTLFTFYETPSGQPQAIKTWFYPGQSFGFDFVYPKGENH